MTAAQAGAAPATDSVDLVDEDDGGRVVFGALEEIAHAGRADADEHLDELRCGDAEEGDIGFTGDGARHQRLARARRADKQDAARHLGADLDVFLRLLEEVNDLLQLQLGGILSGDIVKLDGRHLRRFLPGLRLPEGKYAIHLSLRAPAHPDEESDDENQRQEVDEQGEQQRRSIGRGADDDVLPLRQLAQFFAAARWHIGIEATDILGAAGGVGDDHAVDELAGNAGLALEVE